MTSVDDQPEASGGAGAGVLISAYAASPAHTTWNPGLEAALLPGLCALPGVVGLEVPWLGRIHPHDDGWFLEHVPAGAQLSITALPYVMRRCAVEPRYGIASPDVDGRRAAVADLRMLAADARTIRERSDAVVSFVGLHTAPHGEGDAGALAASLSELADLDWCGAQLVVEHCDAAVQGQPFEKGFLPVVDELSALVESGAPVGLWINWGRSLIELRDIDAVSQQIAEVAAAGVLLGLTFSGAAAIDGPYGAAWSDAHLPIREADTTSGSLLDVDHVRAGVAAAGREVSLGLKVSRRPSDRSADEVLSTVARNLRLLQAAF